MNLCKMENTPPPPFIGGFWERFGYFCVMNEGGSLHSFTISSFACKDNYFIPYSKGISIFKKTYIPFAGNLYTFPSIRIYLFVQRYIPFTYIRWHSQLIPSPTQHNKGWSRSIRHAMMAIRAVSEIGHDNRALK